jgi:hypothetical protein
MLQLSVVVMKDVWNSSAGFYLQDRSSPSTVTRALERGVRCVIGQLRV